MYVVTLLMLTAIAWCVVGVQVFILHEPYSHSALSVTAEQRFTDFTDVSQRVAHFGEPNMLTRTDIKFPYPYPVPSVYAYLVFVRLFRHPLAAYLIFALLSFFIATCFLSLRVKHMGAGWLPQIALWSTLLFGFPLLYLLVRGNIEAVLWVFILLGIVAYARNRLLAAAITWAIATAMKIAPGLFFVLFLARRRYGIFAVAIASTVVLSVLALAGVGPSIGQAALGSKRSAPFLINNYILVRAAPQFDESLFGATKQVISLYDYEHRSSGRHFPQILPGLKRALWLYNLLIPIGAGLLYWFRLRHLPLLNQFIAYVILSILLPQVSYEYKLVYMYLAWGGFLLFLLADVATDRVKIPLRAIHVILFSCAVIFAPLTYLEITGTANRIFAFGAQVKTVFLVLILLTVLRIPMPSSLFGDLPISTVRSR